MRRKRIHRNTLLGQEGISLIEQIVLEMGYLWYQTGGIEAGIDGIIELRDPQTGEVLNSIIQVQSKATDQPFAAETNDEFEFSCDPRDLHYWLQGNAPVILVISRPRTREAYWVSVKDYFSNPLTRQFRKVRLNKKRDRFDKNCQHALKTLGIPKESGIYFAPLPRDEILLSNLLPVVRFADTVYGADTEFRRAADIWRIFKEKNVKAGGEWILKDGRILSVYDLHEPPWPEVCDVGTAESFDLKDWAFSQDPDRRREFVDISNRCLRAKVFRLGVKFDKSHECFYFRASDDLSAREIPYRGLTRKTSRKVFRGYESRVYPGKMAYYRHSAFQGQFRLFDHIWYLEITPTYFFTWDGHHLDGSYEERLKGIKRLERNGAVLGQVIMWASILSKPEGLFTAPYRFLEFGSLSRFRLGMGIDDEAWLPGEEEQEALLARSSIEEGQLF